MLSIKEKGVIYCIIDHCKRVEETINGKTKLDFDNSQDIRDIVCFNILQIGELAKNLSPLFVANHGNVPWKNIKGMKDWVAHSYGTIDFEIIWKTASEDIKPLKDYCEEILQENWGTLFK